MVVSTSRVVGTGIEPYFPRFEGLETGVPLAALPGSTRSVQGLVGPVSV